MTVRDEENRDEIREALNQDTTHAQARAAIELVLDLHHDYQGGRCYECSLVWETLKVLGEWDLLALDPLNDAAKRELGSTDGS